MKMWLAKTALLIAMAASPAVAQSFVSTEDVPPIAGAKPWQGSFDYASASPDPDWVPPWKSVDFTKASQAPSYMEAVLAYVLEGQDILTWDVASNAVRPWFHMPWMHRGSAGREFFHGLTRERDASPGDLHPDQSRCVQTWSVGFFNDVGAATLARVWNTGTAAPDFSEPRFAENTVTAKLLFNEARPADAPFVEGSLAWIANTARRDPARPDRCPPFAERRRTPEIVRLVQLDIAVKDERASGTGWVYGTFVYDGSRPGETWADRLVPIGLTWGNDFELRDDAPADARPKESIVLNTLHWDRTFGRKGRMNGPIDNPNSSCLSCHMTAQLGTRVPMSPGRNEPWDKVKCWFRNLPPTEAFGPEPTVSACGDEAGDLTSFDYSLQMAVAWRNWQFTGPERSGADRSMPSPLSGLSSATEASGAVDLNEAIEFDGATSFPVQR